MFMFLHSALTNVNRYKSCDLHELILISVVEQMKHYCKVTIFSFN